MIPLLRKQMGSTRFFCQAEIFRQMVCEHAGGGCERPLLAREVPTGPPRQGRQEIIKNLPNQQRELIKAGSHRKQYGAQNS